MMTYLCHTHKHFTNLSLLRSDLEFENEIKQNDMGSYPTCYLYRKNIKLGSNAHIMSPTIKGIQFNVYNTLHYI